MEIATVVGKGVNGEGCCVQESVRKWAKACLVGMIARVLVYVARDEGIYRELIDQVSACGRERCCEVQG